MWNRTVGRGQQSSYVTGNLILSGAGFRLALTVLLHGTESEEETDCVTKLTKVWGGNKLAKRRQGEAEGWDSEFCFD